MEVCRCKKFRDIVTKCTIFTAGTFCPPFQCSSVPGEANLHWKRNQTSHEDYRFHRPIVCATIPHTICVEPLVEVIKTVPNRWIPIQAGLIAQRLVNESKGLLKGPI